MTLNWIVKDSTVRGKRNAQKRLLTLQSVFAKPVKSSVNTLWIYKSAKNRDFQS